MPPMIKRDLPVIKYDPTKPALFRVMSRQQVRDFDVWAINEMLIPGVVLMENAGRACAELIGQQLADNENAKDNKIAAVCIFCGTGNNGGDGFVIARHLAGAGIAVAVVICGRADKIKGDALVNLEIIGKMGLPVFAIDMSGQAITARIRELAAGSELIVDAIFGTGLSGPARQPYDSLIEAVNNLAKPIIAVDIPSGLDCDTGDTGDAGDVPGVAIEAAATVTFVAVKEGFARNRSSAKYTGDVYIASIGIEPTD